MQPNVTGLFGKLPAHGDFIYRDLPTHFINRWDEWLQGFVNSSQEQLGEAWLDIYLTSPIWRFALSEGIIDEHVWSGIVLPSVDRVGRYFPFSIVTKQPATTGPAAFFATQTQWFDTIETLALSALDGQVGIDDIVLELNKTPVRINEQYSGRVYGSGNQNTVASLIETASPDTNLMPLLLDASLAQNLQSYSLWQTSGSQYIAPTTFYTKHLPHQSGIASMMDGQWSERQWQPFIINQGAG